MREWTYGHRAGQPFTILVSNFTHAPQQLSKYAIVAWADQAPEYYVPLDIPWSTRTSTEVITAVGNEELRLTQNRSACVQSHLARSQKKAIDDARDWRETVQVGSAFEDRRSDVLHVLEPLHKMWDGQVGLISSAAHEIDLFAGAAPYRSVPYRAGPQMRDIEKAEVNKMVEQGVSVPAPPTD